MQEIKKRTIVLASVLKPADDPRMFDKIGRSLANDYNVFCIGGPIKNDSRRRENANPQVIELSNSGRTSMRRLIAPFSVLRNVIRLKPALLIICTHELLFAALLAKILTRCKVIYDVQENYYMNISFGRSFPFFVGVLLGPYVRAKERISRTFVDHYFLAEKGYEKEMKFFGANRTVLENKVADHIVARPVKKWKPDEAVNLLFSGTLAETTGVFIAIDLAIKLHALHKHIRLKIIGSGASLRSLDLVREKIKDRAFIEFIGGSSFVPHEGILEAIRAADFGIISYPPNPSTYNSIPTKLYEYLGFRLPILLIAHPEWSKQCEPYNAAITFNVVRSRPEDLLNAMKTREFYTSSPEDVYWSSEEKKLMQTIETMRI